MPDPQELFWFNITNILLGVGTACCLAVAVFGVCRELWRRHRERKTV